MYWSKGLFLAEFEKRPAESMEPQPFAAASHLAFQRLQRKQCSESLMSCTANELAQLTGFDRVMIYHFLPEGGAECIAEYHQGRLPFSPLANAWSDAIAAGASFTNTSVRGGGLSSPAAIASARICRHKVTNFLPCSE